MLFKKNLLKILAALFWVGLLGIFFWTKSSYDLSSIDLGKKLYFFLSESSFGPLLFILIYILRPVILFPSLILSVLAGAIFGFWLGFLYTVIGATLSALVAYSFARFLTDEALMALPSRHPYLAGFEREIKEHSFFTVLILRLLYLPFDVVNFFCGAMNVGWKPFALATLLAMIVDTGGFISFGATLENIESFNLSQVTVDTRQLIISFALIAMSFVLAFVAHRHRQKRGAAISKS